MRNILTSIVFVLITIPLFGQKYFTRTAQVAFYSETDMEDIEAVNRSAVSVVNLEDGRIEFSVLIKGFVFEKALMQEHFNENYLESSKYPKAVFKGNILDYDADKYTVEGEHIVKVKGILDLHNVKKEIIVDAKLLIKSDGITGSSTFMVACADFEIDIPSVVRDNIAKEIEVRISGDYIKLDK